MRSFPLLVLFVGCVPSEPQDHLAPDLVEAFAGREPGSRLPVLMTGDLPGDVARFGSFDVGMAELDLAEAIDLGRRHAVYLAPDRPLYGAAGVALHADADLVHRTIGGDDGTTGAGVTIAVVDSGVWREHRDFPAGLLVAWADFVEGDDADARRDPYGHGTAVAGVLSSTRAGLRGVAPEAGIVSARVLGDDGVGRTSAAIAALAWIVEESDETGVRVVNLSVGAPPRESFTLDPLAQAAEGAIEAGLVVVASAGNFGRSDGEEVFGGVVSPATHPGVITVGAADPGGTAVRGDDTVAGWSSRGPTLWDGLGKPDLVAPGVALPLAGRPASFLWKALPGARLDVADGVTLNGAPWLVASGTSFAAPIVSGVVARMLEVNPDLSPVEIKAILELTATQLDADPLAAGAGLLDAAGAVRLAAWWADPGDPVAWPDPVDVIEGEDATWGLGILWDGFAPGSRDLSWLNGGGIRAAGDLAGSGILWDGVTIQYVGYRAAGLHLLSPTAWAGVDLWGNGILWDGVAPVAGSRVWTTPAHWLGGMIDADQLAGVGPTDVVADHEHDVAGLMGGEDAAGLPPEPDFGD